MDQFIAQRDLRNDVAAILRRVSQGERFTVTVRGEPVAQLVPLREPRRFVPRNDVMRILRDTPLDAALLQDLRTMDVDDESDPWDDRT